MGEMQSLLVLKQVVHIGTVAFETIKFMLFSSPVCPYICPLTARYEHFGYSGKL